MEDHGLSFERLAMAVEPLILAGEASAIFGIRVPNPHIRAIDDDAPEVQIRYLKVPENQSHGINFYPTERTLRDVRAGRQFSHSPYSKLLALGRPQLSFVSFDLSILEHYREDPRYHYEVDDVSGWLGVRDEYYLKDEKTFPEKHKVSIQSFGFSFDKALNRHVAVFLRYLHDLSQEHQNIWKAHEVEGDLFLHPDYFRSAFLGEFYEGISIFEAFLEEIRVTNLICANIGRPALFRASFEPRPRQLAFLLRPTVKEYQHFILTLDKMLSENIDPSFFGDDIELETEKTDRKGRVRVERKGSITCLQEWLTQRFRVEDRAPMQEMLDTFREIRKLRQRPAHTLDDNRFDPALARTQRELMIRAYTAIRTLRLVLQNHPKAGSVEMSDALATGKGIRSH
jgi:hypothetical protein